jgi:hypothetical protein
MGYGTTSVAYNGTNRGSVYLRDVGQRNGLGGGRSIYVRGQDRYISYGQTALLVSTSDVMTSTMSGVIKKMADLGSFSVTINPDS